MANRVLVIAAALAGNFALAPVGWSRPCVMSRRDGVPSARQSYEAPRAPTRGSGVAAGNNLARGP